MEELIITIVIFCGGTAIFFIIKDEYMYSYNQKRTIRVNKKTKKIECLINNQWEKKL